MGPAAIAAIGAGVAGLGSLAGGELAAKRSRHEARKQRAFQERMRNTQWQAAIADMQAAGINPAIAYSKGPAASPVGAQASQMDSVSPAISSALQARRMQADLQLIRQQTAKAKEETRDTSIRADTARARLFSYGFERGPMGLKMKMGDDLPRMVREIESSIQLAEANARKAGASTEILRPLADLSNRLGEWLPILFGLSQLSPGGMLRSGRNIFKGKRLPFKGR